MEVAMDGSEKYKDELRQLLFQSSPFSMRALVLRLLPFIPDRLLLIVVSIAARGIYQEADGQLLEQVLARLSPEARENAFEELFLELREGEDDFELTKVLVTL